MGWDPRMFDARRCEILHAGLRSSPLRRRPGPEDDWRVGHAAISVPALEPTLDPLPRELAYRRNGALDVFLLWHPAGDALTVVVEDLRTGVRVEMAVDRRDALAAFNHPFAYAP
jgi:hypothetical protein